MKFAYVIFVELLSLLTCVFLLLYFRRVNRLGRTLNGSLYGGLGGEDDFVVSPPFLRFFLYLFGISRFLFLRLFVKREIRFLG